MIEKDTIRLLRECDAGVKMGIYSIDDVLDRVKNGDFQQMLRKCKEGHEKLEREIAENKTDSHRRMEFLTHQIELKDQRIDRLMTRVDGVLETNREILASNRELMAQIQKLIEKLGK